MRAPWIRELLARARALGPRVRALADRARALSAFDRARYALAAVAAIALVVLLATEPGRDAPPLREAGGRGASEPEQRSFLARMIPPVPEPRERRRPSEGRPRTVEQLAEEMSDEQRVAQLFLLGFEGTDATASIFRRLRRNGYGGLVFGAQNYLDRDQLALLTGEAEVVADDAGQAPPFLMAVQEGAKFNSFADLPPKDAPADLASPKQAARGARESGRSLRDAGINGVLGPVVDIGAEGGAVGSRAFSDSPEAVVQYAEATTRGYRAAKIVSAPKHFPGLGGASQSTDAGPAHVGLADQELLGRDVLPFRAAIEAGAPAVVVGHGLYASDDFVTPASQSRALIEDLLRRRLGFHGLAITDDLSAPAVTAVDSIPDAAVSSLKAGADMVWIRGPQGEQEAAYLAVLNAVRKEEIPEERVQAALLRVLAAKRAAGIL